jgi:hypothetical protein
METWGCAEAGRNRGDYLNPGDRNNRARCVEAGLVEAEMRYGKILAYLGRWPRPLTAFAASLEGIWNATFTKSLIRSGRVRST